MNNLTTILIERISAKAVALSMALLLMASACPAFGTLYINEILFNPPGSPDDPFEYVELRSEPNATISSNTYLVAVDGGVGDVGKVRNVFPVSGMMIGNNGFLVLLQKNPSYTISANGIAVTNVGTKAGWGDGSGSSIGHNGNNGATNLENPSVTFMLIQAPATPTPSDNIDANNDGILDGVGTNWTILDAFGILDNTGSGERAFGKINFRRNSAAAASNTIVAVSFTPGYVGRAGNSTGWAGADWVASDVAGTGPNWTCDSTKTVPSTYQSSALDHVGKANFGATDFAGVKLVQSGGVTQVSESGGTDTYTLELNATPSGAVTIQITADGEIEVSTNGTTFGSSRTVTFNSANTPQTVTVRAADDTKVETAVHAGVITHAITTTADTVKYPTTAIIPTVVAQVSDNDVALLSEVKVNPPGSSDVPFEFVEFRGSAGAILTNLYLVALDGSGTNKGGIDMIVPLNTSLGSNGQLVVVGSGHPYSLPSAATVITNAQFGDTNQVEGALQNGTISILLVSSPSPLTLGQDLDPSDSGTLTLPAGATVMDAVGWTDGDAGDVVYGGVALTQSGWTPDAATRFAGNNTQNSSSAWFCGELLGGTGAGLNYNPAQVSTNALVGATLTPGQVNHMPPAVNLPSAWSGVVGDSGNPSLTFMVEDAETSVTNLTVTVNSGSPTNLPNDRLALTGGGGVWTLAINPTNKCYDVPILITVSDGESQTVKTLRYAASASWRTNAHFYLGFGDGSAAIPIDDDYMLVADDETYPIRLVSRKQSGPAIREFDFREALGMTNRYPESGELYEADFEGATRSGNVIYWICSLGNGADGRKLPSRKVLFATQISGTGTNVSLTLIGHYNYLRSDIINWDSQGQHGKGAFYYGLLDSAADLHVPKTIDGFNIEGLTMALGEANTNVALLAFRAPLVPITQRHKALLLPVTNLISLVSGVTNFGVAKFGTPIELDLGGRGIRSIELYDNGYLIVAGPWGASTGDPYEFRLFTWTGDPNHAPQEMSANLSGLNPEGIIGLSGGTLSSTSQVQVVSDNGSTQWYLPQSNKETKDLPEENFKKCRSDWITVGNPVPSQNIWSENTEATGGRFVRGTGTNTTFQSHVASLDGIKGVRLDDQGGEFYPGNDWTNTLYHRNATTPSSPIAFQNPIAAFGADVGGTPLEPNRTYTFRAGFGDRPRSAVETGNAGFEIAIYDRRTFQRVTNVVIPLSLDPWFQVADFSREGIIVDLPQFGLQTRIRPALNEIMDTDGFYISHRAVKTEYVFAVGGLGYVPSSNTPPRSSMVSNLVAAAVSPLYVFSFDRSPAWRSDFVLQPHFEGEPLPPEYAGKTVTELLYYSAPLTNQISLAGSPGSYTNLDASPELRRHPILDELVSDLNRDPVALANYVQNEIQLTDTFTYSDEQNGEASVNHGGMNRGALATFMEGQGSPLEQCSLLVYLLRQAGVPAVYVFPSQNGLKLLDARVSRLLRCQLRSETNSEPRLIPVNYPWVAAYDGTNWIHLFPWLKDTELQEGLNLYEYLPDQFNNGYKWALEYLRMNNEIFQLGMAKDTPAELFPAFVQHQLYTQFPGITLADLGMKIQDRKRHCSRWQDFPKPTQLTNQVFAVESMGKITNTFPSLTNVFNTLSVEVCSVTNPTQKILTGELRLLDLHNRRFTLWYQPTNFDHQMILTLDSFRPDATNRYSFAAADTLSATNTRIANIISVTNLLGATDDTLTLKFGLKRHASLSFLPNSPTGALPSLSSRQIVTPLTETVTERVIRKGDLIAICVNPGRVSPKMFTWHQERYSALDAKAKADSQFRSQLTSEAYEGQLTYLLGMYYFTGVDRFSKMCQQLHKVQTVSWFSLGLAKFGAKRNTSDTLPAGNVTFKKAILDIFFQELTTVGNGSSHPDRETDPVSVNDSFSTLLMLNSAAQEHAALDRFFGRTNAISTVTLLQKATLKTTPGLDFGVIELTKENYLAQGERLFNVGASTNKLKEFDPTIWQTITNTFALEGVSNSLRALVTPGFVTNAVGAHFGALLFGGKFFASLLSPYSINGGVADLGEDCVEVNLFLGNDCAYHFREWFGDHLYQGDRVVGCAAAPPGTPFTITACCEDLGICDNPASDIETLSISISEALAAQAKEEQRRFSRQIATLQESPLNNYDFSYRYELNDSETFNTAPQSYNLSASGGGPRVTDFNNYFSPTPLTQTEFDLRVQNTGFVGAERFVDNFSWSHNHPLVSDPVNAMTGEFYAQEEDLRLSGPFPLSLRRNYSSRNKANNDLGYGWNLAFFPYLTVTLDGAKIYAVDPGGSVISYRRQGSSTNWFPDLTDNKEWSNQNVPGQSVSANQMLSTLTLETIGTNSYYRVNLPDGSRRTYLGRKFQNGSVDRDRPYLIEWADHRGNSYAFFYGEEPGRNDYGKLRRIKSSSGDSLVLAYDDKGHVSEALASDGRRVRYFYDNFGEDLTSVLLPDGSRIQYSYERVLVPTSVSTIFRYVITPIYILQGYKSLWVSGHFQESVWIPGHFEWGLVPGYWDYIRTLGDTTTVTNFGSSHRIVSEVRPEGRVLQNIYDTSGRVTEQWATVGLDLRPVQNATFIYSNDFTLTGTNAVSGFTLIVDALNHTNRYDYTNGLITKITDPFGTGIAREWYAQSGNGGYTRSLKSRTDQRGQTQTFIYDAWGNIVTNIISGADLTGDGVTNVVYSFAYNTNSAANTLIRAVAPLGRAVETIYDPVFTRLPQYIVSYASNGVAISTNALFYTNATTVLSYATNSSFGLLARTVIAYRSSDAATNDFEFDGRGLMTRRTQYPSTGDPNVVTKSYYNNRGELVESEDAAGTRRRNAYNERGQLTVAEIYESGTSSAPVAWEFFYYNANGELTWSDGPRFDPEDYVWRDYDGAGRLTQAIRWRSRSKANGSGVEAETGDALYATIFNDYDLFGNLTKATDVNGNYKRKYYDAMGRLVREEFFNAAGNLLATNGLAYSAAGDVTNAFNALGGSAQMQYTTTGRLKFQRHADGGTNAWLYYADGRLRREIQGNGAYWQTAYDDANRKTTRVFYSAAGTPLATNISEFDRRGNLVKATDAAGNAFTNVYDGLDRLKVSVGPPIVTVSGGSIPGVGGGTTTNVLQQAVTNYFDAAGVVLTNVNALGEKSITWFDVLGRTKRAEIRSANGTLVRETRMAFAPDHHSVTITNGSGANAIVNTAFTDNDGQPLLSIAYPSANVREFARNKYDLAGNLIYSERDSSSNGTVTVWTSTTATFDGLNRMLTVSDRDAAVTTFGYNALGNVTNRVMPGGLKWQARYNSAGQMLEEMNVGNGSATTRTNTYAYYAINSPFAGLPQTRTDGRGVICTYTFDDWLRPLTNSHTGPLAEHNLKTIYQYDVRGYITNLIEQFTNNAIGPATAISRKFDVYGQLINELLMVGSNSFSGAGQTWDAVGRRTTLGFGNGYNFGWQAAGALTSVSYNLLGGASYGYNTTGLLTNRTVGSRSTTTTSRDGTGRPLAISTTINGTSKLNEALTWTGDGLLKSHALERVGNFTDDRAYFYADASRRLVEERLNLDASKRWTNFYSFDGGTAAGPGVLTKIGQTPSSSQWSGVTDAFSRVSRETNTVARQLAYGRVNGPATITAALDGVAQPVIVLGTGNSLWTNQWRTTMEMTPGKHQLTVSAAHPSGQFTTNTTSWFTNNLGSLTVTNVMDASGNLTQRIWRKPNGNTNAIQTFAWDAPGRLTKVTERDSTQSGRDFTITYDAFGRRLRTTEIIVTNNIALTNQPIIVSHYFDPLVEFLELGVAENGKITWKLMGPDMDGVYGGQNGTGGFEGEASGLTFASSISDAFGNVIASYSGTLSWNSSRLTGYGSVAGYKPLPYGSGGTLAVKSSWRNRASESWGGTWMGGNWLENGRFLSPDPLGHFASPSLYEFCNGAPVGDIWDADGRVVIQQWEARQVELMTQGGLWNNLKATGISLKYASLSLFSLGSFNKNDRLADRNLAGEISDAQFYGGMTVNAAAAGASLYTGGAAGTFVAGRMIAAGAKPLVGLTVSGAASGFTASVTDIATTRAGYAVAGIGYEPTIGQDLTSVGISTGMGAGFGFLTYAGMRGEGIIYNRTDANGHVDPYYGQAESPGRFDARQGEHARKLPNSQLEFEPVDAGKPGQNLDFIEQWWISAKGGARSQNPNTPLSNRIRAMSDERFGQILDNAMFNTGVGSAFGNGASGIMISKKPH